MMRVVVAISMLCLFQATDAFNTKGRFAFASSTLPQPALRSPQTKSGTAALAMSKHASAGNTEQNRIDRKQFGKVAAFWILGSSAASPVFASESGLKCKAAIGGGQTCAGSKEIKFTKAYDTAGSTTKVTGDPKKMATYYSQIHAGLETLEELDEKWDGYIEAGDGDVVRRRLGTVGNKSPLHNIRKAFEGALKVAAKSPVLEPEELDALDEDFNAILQGIAEVDYNLYSTAFVGTDETASKLRADGKQSLKKALKLYRNFDAECAKVL